MKDSQTKSIAPRVNDCDRVLRLLDELVDLEEADLISLSRENTVYKASVVLWTLVCQRMSCDTTMESAVKLLLEHKPSLLPANNKRVSGNRLSNSTGAYSKARSRLNVQAAKWLAQSVSNSLIESSPATFENQRVFTLDGTGILLPPEPEFRRLYPPASDNSAWPVALLVVAHELSSATALLPKVGAMYGENAVSETALIGQALEQMPKDSLVMADSNFGIFAVAHQISTSDKRFVLRLTKQRFKSMYPKAKLIDQGENYKTWFYAWKPTPKDRAGRPHITPDITLHVWLHEIVVHEDLKVYLVTDQNYHAETFAELYVQRGTIEIDIRNFKIVLDAEHLRARSQDTFEKELLASTVAYNLIVQFRRQAASGVNLPPRRLSFKRVCTTFRTFLMSKMFADGHAWVAAYERALGYAQKEKLPNRPGRHYEREAYRKSNNPQNYKRRIPKCIQKDKSG